MIFYLHYILLTSGLSGTSVLLGVFLKAYSDANQGEIGMLLMTFPFLSIIVKPLFCCMADRSSAHKLYLLISLVVMLIGFTPFIVIPFFPNFYTVHPRISWWLLVAASEIGLGALGVAWSLGDTLAMNASQRHKTPYSRMRLMGTVSWGLYGYIIGQINETPGLPKFIPSFLILYVSVVIEIVLLLFWKNEDFQMYDPTGEPSFMLEDAQKEDFNKKKSEKLSQTNTSTGTLNKLNDVPDLPGLRHLREMDVSGPASLSGSLRLNKATGMALRDILSSDDISRKLNMLEEEQMNKDVIEVIEPQAKSKPTLEAFIEYETNSAMHNQDQERKNQNLQVMLFKMILVQDKRMIKYIILFTLYGSLIAPINFLFLSMEDVCKKEGCHFSHLAGSVLISQATIETLAFFVMPWFLKFMSAPLLFTCGLIMMSCRNFFYAGFYYTSDISPYFALIAEWGHGISFGIFATLMADVALMFANQCESYIPKLRKSGMISALGSASPEKIKSEELAIKMALRATMQAVFGGVMDGLGQGAGNLVSGLVYDIYGCITFWQLFTIIAISTCVLHQLVEASKCRFSDNPQRKTTPSVLSNNVINEKAVACELRP